MNTSILKPMKLSQKYLYMLYISFLPLLTKGFRYALIGSPYIMILGLITIAMLLYTIHFKKSQTFMAIKIWSLLLISYGSIRLLLTSMNLFTDAIESAIVYQLTLWYYFKSVLYIMFGLFLYLEKTRQRVTI